MRDMILKLDPEDFDIATSAKPEEIEKLFKKTYSIGKHFGVILIEEAGHHFEVATFRSDSGYSDGRRPDYVAFTSAKEDALRRDFTINGIFYDPVAEVFHDFVGGKSDLKRGILRFIGDPNKRIQEDHLRILRAVRFKNRFNLSYCNETKEALRKHASLVVGISAERIFSELSKKIVQEKRVAAFKDLDEFGILKVVLPEVDALKNVPQDKDMHSEGDAFVHSLNALGKVQENASLELFWAALLHDVGKADTVKYQDGRIRFLRHQDVGIAKVKDVLRRLKFSKFSRDKICWLIHHHHIFDDFPKMSRVKKLHYFDNPHFADLLELHHADILGAVPADFSGRAEVESQFFEIKAEFLTAHAGRELPSHHKELLTGGEIMEIMGISAGEKVGVLKGRVREWQLEKIVGTKGEARKKLLEMKKEE